MRDGDPPDLESGIDRLYAGPLDSFVAERKALAARLRSAGEREAARRVSGLPRPSATAWAVNQLWWHRRGLCEAVRESGLRVRGAQEGRPDAPALGEALAERRAALSAATRAALESLESAGRGAGLAVERRIRGSFEALAAGADPAGGRLEADLEPPSFDAISGLTPVLTPRRPAAESPPAADTTAGAPADEGGEDRRLAEAECDRLERRLARAEEAERAAVVRAEAARAEIGEAEQRLDRARRRSAEVKADLERCQEDARHARESLAVALEKLAGMGR